MSTYSIELSRLLLASCSQIEIVGKTISSIVGKKVENIRGIMMTLTKSDPSLIHAKVTIPRYSLESEPWKAWANTKTPVWWKAYNSTKHDEENALKKATLRNCIDAIAALLLITLVLGHHRRIDAFKPNTSLFYPPEDFASLDMMPDGGITDIKYGRPKKPGA
ncbi:hypothetical protein [Stenotrophomonas sp. NPDC077659]|uniref:hypothetical protein n=1 Tax=Stenotrophomonas sp. NPDC077659 TaxID=3390694 RepID=UPI003D057D6D